MKTRSTIFNATEINRKTGKETKKSFILEIPSEAIEGRYSKIEEGSGFCMTIIESAGEKARSYYCEAISYSEMDQPIGKEAE